MQEAKDRHREQLTPKLVPLPYEAYPSLSRYTQDLPPVIELADNRIWENGGEPTVITA